MNMYVYLNWQDRSLYFLYIERTIVYYRLKMDADLYDEFGNYMGPDLESEEEEEPEEDLQEDGFDDEDAEMNGWGFDKIFVNA